MARATTFTLGGSSRLGLLLAGLLAAVTGVLVYAAVSSGSDDGPADGAGALTLVVRASEDIPASTTITSSMLEEVRVPQGALLAGAFAEDELVVGRVARIPIYKGEQLVQEKLAVPGSVDGDELGLSFVVPEGMRAMAVGVDKVVGVGGNIRPGDRVDILAVLDITVEDLVSEESTELTRAFVVGQNVEVLAVEQELQNRPLSGNTSSADSDGTIVDQPDAQPDGTVVTLSLTPEQLQQVVLADERGSIRLAVRAPGDTGVTSFADLSPIQFLDPEFLAALQAIFAERAEANQ